MSSFLDKIKIKTGLGKMNKFDLSCDHVTTQEFFNLRPVYCRELMPKQSISVSSSSVVRCAPFYKPFFGGVRMINRGFFVPYRTVFDGFTNFLENTPYNHDGSSYMLSQVPTLSTGDLVHCLKDSAYSSHEAYDNTKVYDFVDPTENYGYTLTRKGQILLTIFNSLGYSLNFVDTSYNNLDFGVTCSALPLMAFLKIISDWYINNQYTTRRDAINNFITSCWQGGFVDGDALLNTMQYVVYSLYDNDYFTSAFDNPVNPSQSAISSVSIHDVTNDRTGSNNYGTVVSSRSSSNTNYPSTPVLNQVNNAGTAVSNVTQFILDSLKSLTDWMKRYQLVGSSTLDRMLAEYGVQLNAEKLNRSVYLGKSETYIEVTDVMAQADVPSGSVLGDYAGKGIGYMDGNRFSYKADEFGIMIIVSTIVPRVAYSQGIIRQNLHIDRFDFFRGDFDALGPQAIARCELYNDANKPVNFTSLVSQNWSPSGIFGYAPRYCEYCIANDFLSGMFRVNTQNADLKQWHLFRMFDPETQEDGELLAHHSEQFSVGDPDQYNRIFNYSAEDTDHFFVVHHFNVESYMPKKPLYDQYDFDGGDTIMMNLGGTNLN